VGQPLFLCLALGLCVVAAARLQAALAAGVLLGRNLQDPPRAGVRCPALFRREPRTLVAAVLTIAILNGVFVALCDRPSPPWQASATTSAAAVRQSTTRSRGYPLSRRIVWSTSVAALAELYVPAAWRYSVLLDAALLAALLPFWIRPLVLDASAPARAFSLFAVVTLLTTRTTTTTA